jgi:mannose-6-phosphate isomerase
LFPSHDPWGWYDELLSTKYCKVKEITVSPGQRLSYQYHTKRREQWTVVKGNLTIILDGDKIFRYPGESIHIPMGAKHRAWNETDEDVVFIEVQTGTYFGEDDIVRLEDDYERGDYEHLKDWVDIKEDQIKNKTDWWSKMSDKEWKPEDDGHMLDNDEIWD